MTKLFVNKIKSFILKYWILLFLLGITAYFVSCLVINFIGKPCYNVDMYSDAFLSELMGENMTLFPEEWTFGNQYYILATPVLAAILGKLTDSSFYAMALASCIMTIGVYLSYIWCLKPFVQKKIWITGLFVLSGGILFGTSASRSILGFQVLYTMASYYACYTIGIFFTLGIFLRIYKNVHISKRYFVIAVLLNFTLGMNSMRETLILNLPLIVSSFYLFLLRKENSRKNILFSFGMLFSNVAGVMLMKILVHAMNIRSQDVLVNIRLCTFQEFVYEHIPNEARQFGQMTGVCFWEMIKYDKVYIVIFGSVIFTFLCVGIAIVAILVKKDTSPLAMAILFCVISILLVLCVGLFFFRNRDLYYFVWYFLVTLSMCYCMQILQGQKIGKGVLLSCLLCIGMVNYYCNFYTDFVHYHDQNEFYSELTEELLADDIQYIYTYEWDKTYPIYCYSNNHIKIGTYVNIDRNGLARPLQPLKCDYVFNKESLNKAYFVFSDSIFQTLTKEKKKEFEKFLSQLQFVKEKSYSGKNFNTVFKMYKAKEDVFYRGNE